MNSYGQAFYSLKNELCNLYDEQEASAIAHEVLEDITGLTKIDRLMLKDALFNAVQENAFDYMMDELLQGKPLQYVTGKAYFMERRFEVNEQVLIPRPETEELVIWIINDHQASNDPKRILDIGTGSGCIPISLQLEMPAAVISSCDISKGALEVAQRNAQRLNANVHFIALDFLNKDAQASLPMYDIVVSNPPYIPRSEEREMHTNVKSYEPGTALFVPDDDPLLFYRTIADFGKTHLNNNGAIYCELHRDFAHETKALFRAAGYKNVVIQKDMHDNWRMLKATMD